MAFDFFFHWAWIKIDYYLFQGDLPRLLVQEFKVNFFYNVKSSLIYRLLGFLKNHRRGDQDFLVKMGGGLSIEGSRGISTAFH